MAAFLDLIAASERPPLWLDYTAYAGRLLAGGEPPWLDVSGYVAWQRKAQGLLKSEVIHLPVAAVCMAWLAAHPDLRETMGGKRRATFPLKVLLADDALRQHLAELIGGLSACFPKTPLALVLPSPRQWAALAYAQGHGTADGVEIGGDEVESAAMLAADFLRVFGDSGLGVLLLEETPGTAPAGSDEIEWYRPVLNVCAHYRWDCGLHLPAGAPDPGGVDGLHFAVATAALNQVLAGIAVPESFWSGTAAVITVGRFRFARIPAQASPEAVLDRLVMLR